MTPFLKKFAGTNAQTVPEGKYWVITSIGTQGSISVGSGIYISGTDTFSSLVVVSGQTIGGSGLGAHISGFEFDNE